MVSVLDTWNFVTAWRNHVRFPWSCPVSELLANLSDAIGETLPSTEKYSYPEEMRKRSGEPGEREFLHGNTARLVFFPGREPIVILTRVGFSVNSLTYPAHAFCYHPIGVSLRP